MERPSKLAVRSYRLGRKHEVAAGSASHLFRQTALSAPAIFVPAVDRRVRRRLAPATGDSVLGLNLDWPARVAEVAPHFVAHS